MLGVKLICVGRMRERHYIGAFAEYEKRLRAFCRFELCEIAELRLSDDPSESEVRSALKREAEAIGKAIPAGACVIAMCVEGERLTSTALAQLLQKNALSGKSRICFIIGGSYGLDEGIKSNADVRLSMSDMTFPHHLARVMLAEQVYRAFTINGNVKYHK